MRVNVKQLELGMRGNTTLGVIEPDLVERKFCRDCNETDQSMLMRATGRPQCANCNGVNIGTERVPRKHLAVAR